MMSESISTTNNNYMHEKALTKATHLKDKIMTKLSSMKSILVLSLFLFEISSLVSAYSSSEPRSFSRRAALSTAFSAMAAPLPALAAPDCFKDCMKNCKLIAPKDPDYCLANCKGYCEQDDRNDGLSGSVSASSGEVGILGE